MCPCCCPNLPAGLGVYQAAESPKRPVEWLQAFGGGGRADTDRTSMLNMVSHGSLRRRNWPSGRWTFMAPSWTPSPNPTDCPALSRPASKLGSSSPQRSLSSTLARCDTPSAPAVAADSTVPLCAPGSATISTVTRVSQRRTAILMDTKCDHKNHNCVLIATAIPISSVMRKLEQLQARTARTASGRGARTLNQHFAVASKKIH